MDTETRKRSSVRTTVYTQGYENQMCSSVRTIINTQGMRKPDGFICKGNYL
jgi:hypothetical protein